MNEIDIAPGLRVSCNKGSLYFRSPWLEYTPPGAPKTTACGVRLLNFHPEYLRGRITELNAIIKTMKDSRFKDGVITLEEV